MIFTFSPLAWNRISNSSRIFQIPTGQGSYDSKS